MCEAFVETVQYSLFVIEFCKLVIHMWCLGMYVRFVQRAQRFIFL